MMDTLRLAFCAAFTASATEPGSHVVRDESSTSASRMPYGGTNDTACSRAQPWVLDSWVSLLLAAHDSHHMAATHWCVDNTQREQC